MLEWLSIFCVALLAHNFVLTQFLGLCPFVGVSTNLPAAIGMSFATSSVMTIAAACGFVITHYLLEPFGIDYLLPFFAIITIALLVQATEILLTLISPLLSRALGIYLPLITSNCAVLAVSLLVVRKQDTLLAATLEGFGAGTGFSLVLILFAAMRERIALGNPPALVTGTPLLLFTIAISSLGFMGFVGLG